MCACQFFAYTNADDLEKKKKNMVIRACDFTTDVT